MPLLTRCVRVIQLQSCPPLPLVRSYSIHKLLVSVCAQAHSLWAPRTRTCMTAACGPRASLCSRGTFRGAQATLLVTRNCPHSSSRPHPGQRLRLAGAGLPPSFHVPCILFPHVPSNRFQDLKSSSYLFTLCLFLMEAIPVVSKSRLSRSSQCHPECLRAGEWYNGSVGSLS